MHLNNLKKSEYVQSNNFVNAFFNGSKWSNTLYKIEERLYLPSILDKKIVRHDLPTISKENRYRIKIRQLI